MPEINALLLSKTSRGEGTETLVLSSDMSLAQNTEFGLLPNERNPSSLKWFLFFSKVTVEPGCALNPGRYSCVSGGFNFL